MNLKFVKDLEIKDIEKIRDGFEWFYSHQEYLKRYYSGKHVAIKDQKVIDCDKNLDRLIKRLRIRDCADSIAVEFVFP